MNPNRPTVRHIIIKVGKVKERILTATRKKQGSTYKGKPVRLSADLSAETLQARREWHDVFKVLKGKNLGCSIQKDYQEAEIKNYSDRQKLNNSLILNLP